ncbi:MAG: hypothetical protein SF029_23580 [bacterium]|nr:hypothetical protein [bacterium]
MAIFPSVKGNNLEGKTFRIPADLAGEYNLVLMPFEQYQQYEVDTWLPLAQALQSKYADVRYYELPTLPPYAFWQRMMIDGGMRMGIPNRATREITITLYLDLPPFLQALNIPDPSKTQIMLVRRDGEVL